MFDIKNFNVAFEVYDSIGFPFWLTNIYGRIKYTDASNE